MGSKTFSVRTIATMTCEFSVKAESESEAREKLQQAVNQSMDAGRDFERVARGDFHAAASAKGIEFVEGSDEIVVEERQ